VVPPTIAPGWPGAEPRWTASNKSGVGTARSLTSKVWYTLGQGILTEVYYPRLDQACIKDMQLLVTDGAELFTEEKAGTDSQTAWVADGVPGFRLVNRCKAGRFEIDKLILTDPLRDVLLQKTIFTPLMRADYRVHVLLAPHFANQGRGNNARVGEYKGVPMLFAEANGLALALACSVPWRGLSVGYVGTSDGWQDLHAHKRMTWQYQSAPDGTVALFGEVDLPRSNEFVLAIGFGRSPNEAALHARLSLHHGFEEAAAGFIKGWKDWHSSLRTLPSSAGSAIDRATMAVLGTHESKSFQGGSIASLCIPWGEAHGDRDMGGYHVIWPRDACESIGALLSVGGRDEARRALYLFAATQEADGHWSQNMWIDGTAYWNGIQLDEVAAPVLLLDLARRHGALSPTLMPRFWPMVRAALGYILRQGPSTPQDRWEKNGGLTASTLGVTMAALLVGADLAETQGEVALANYCRETADAWNGAIERWLYAEGGPLGLPLGVPGYYVRLAPRSRLSSQGPLGDERLRIANRPDDSALFPVDEIISPDALALVRFGLRAADDPRVVDTVRVIDAHLKIETPRGPCWRRYSHDGYGEHNDGSPFDGQGVGRGWPLLVGERAHYELAAGHVEEAQRLLEAMTAFASDTGLIPEQVWDGPALPERNLFPGRATGSAQPLVWAHAEHLKLRRSLADGEIFDLPPQTKARYILEQHPGRHAPWRMDAPIPSMPAGKILRIEAADSFHVRWSVPAGTAGNLQAAALGVGLWFCDLPSQDLKVGTRLLFSLYWSDHQGWQGDFEICIL
jgi:glucoamylase